MKKIIFILFLVLGVMSLKAQETVVEIKISNEKTGDYWVQVADRNCGAKSNGLNSYGEYYSWSMGNKKKERNICDAAAKACREFRGGEHSDWRLPDIKEVMALMTRSKREASYATLNSERMDTTATIYFPYAGMISIDKEKLVNAGNSAYFWSDYGSKGSSYALLLMFTKEYYNNPRESKKSELSVRCVRTVK